jgi:hypothetical protein
MGVRTKTRRDIPAIEWARGFRGPDMAMRGKPAALEVYRDPVVSAHHFFIVIGPTKAVT